MQPRLANDATRPEGEPTPRACLRSAPALTFRRGAPYRVRRTYALRRNLGQRGHGLAEFSEALGCSVRTSIVSLRSWREGSRFPRRMNAETKSAQAVDRSLGLAIV